MKRLLIFLPTYNRLAQLQVCVGRLIEEVSGLESEVVIHISDNASTDGTAEFLRGLSHPAIQSSRNPSNIGLPGNILKVHEFASLAEYTWAIGDDDALTAGAIRRLLDATRRYPAAELFFLNTVSYERAEQGDRWAQIVANGYAIRPEWGPPKSRIIMRDFACTVSELFDPRIDPVFFGSLMCYAWRSDSVSNRLRPDEVSVDFSKPKAIYHVVMNYLYCLTPSTPAAHLSDPFTMNFWHGGSDWGARGHDLAVTQGLGIILCEAFRLGYVERGKQPAYVRHYMAIAGDAYRRLLELGPEKFASVLAPEFHPRLAELLLQYELAPPAEGRRMVDRLLDISPRKLGAYTRYVLRGVRRGG